MENEKGKIRGVPFVDAPEQAGQPDAFKVFIRLRVEKLERQQKWTLGIALASIIISAVILAARFV